MPEISHDIALSSGSRATDEQIQLPQGREDREARSRANIARNQGLIQLLHAWNEEDTTANPRTEEPTWEELAKALDADRLSARPLFP